MTRPIIGILGLGYVGLSTAVCLASRGFKVLGIDVDEEKIALITGGEAPIYEPGLQELLACSVKKGLLRCILDQEEAVLKTAITFVTVGTPNRPDGRVDVKYVEEASMQIGEALRRKKGPHLVVLRSTVTPGTTDQVVKATIENFSEKKCGLDWSLCANPEFLREGSAIHDTLHPDRIIIGEHDKASGDQLQSLYRHFYGAMMPPTLRTTTANAELIKYASNAFLAMKVSYINMIANLCQRIPGADVSEVAKGIGLDPRIGSIFLQAGLGYGGSCFPKDLRALTVFARNLGVKQQLVEATLAVNEQQFLKSLDLTNTLLGELSQKRIAVLGLAFKPETDDLREAVSIKLVKTLLGKGAEVVVYDPMAIKSAQKIFGDSVAYASSALGCLDGADCCIIVTEWAEFRGLRPKDFLERMRTPAVIDGRRIFDPKTFQGKIKFAAIGLGPEQESAR